jgi:hypothetical protein
MKRGRILMKKIIEFGKIKGTKKLVVEAEVKEIKLLDGVNSKDWGKK